jgi:hypothetical protein
MGGARSTYGKHERFTVFWWENLWEIDHSEDLGIGGKTVLKRLKNGDGGGGGARIDWPGSGDAHRFSEKTLLHEVCQFNYQSLNDSTQICANTEQKFKTALHLPHT